MNAITIITDYLANNISQAEAQQQLAYIGEQSTIVDAGQPATDLSERKAPAENSNRVGTDRAVDPEIEQLLKSPRLISTKRPCPGRERALGESRGPGATPRERVAELVGQVSCIARSTGSGGLPLSQLALQRVDAVLGVQQLLLMLSLRRLELALESFDAPTQLA